MARDPNLNNESAEPLIRAHSVDSLVRSQSLDDQLLVSVLPEELLKNCKVDKWSSDEIKVKFDEITKVVIIIIRWNFAGASGEAVHIKISGLNRQQLSISFLKLKLEHFLRYTPTF